MIKEHLKVKTELYPKKHMENLVLQHQIKEAELKKVSTDGKYADNFCFVGKTKESTTRAGEPGLVVPSQTAQTRARHSAMVHQSL